MWQTILERCIAIHENKYTLLIKNHSVAPQNKILDTDGIMILTKFHGKDGSPK